MPSTLITTNADALKRAARTLSALPAPLSSHGILNVFAASIAGPGRNWGFLQNAPSGHYVQPGLSQDAPKERHWLLVVEGRETFLCRSPEEAMQHFDVLAAHAENIVEAREDLLQKGAATLVHYDHDHVRVHLVKPAHLQSTPAFLYPSQAGRPGVPLTDLVVDQLRSYIRAGRGMVVSGATGIGKTTLVRSLCAAIPHTQSVACIEEFEELVFDHPTCHRHRYSRRAIEGTDGHVSTAFQNALKTKPAWIAMSELTSRAHFALYAAAGCEGVGTLATVHAASPQHAVERIVEGVQEAHPNLPLRSVRTQVAQGTGISVYLSASAVGKTPRVEAAFVGVDAQGAFVFEPIAF